MGWMSMIECDWCEVRQPAGRGAVPPGWRVLRLVGRPAAGGAVQDLCEIVACTPECAGHLVEAQWQSGPVVREIGVAGRLELVGSSS